MPVDFYFDFLSPYAYLAWRRAPVVLPRAALRPRAVLLGPILGHHGQLGPAEIPAKRAFLIRDVLRRAAEAGVPFQWPARHPFKPTLAARVVHAADEGDRPRLVDSLFAAAWEHGHDLEDAATVRSALTVAGLDATSLLARAAQPATSVALRAEVNDAIARGVFGVPCFIDDDGELFFGDDQLERIARKLAGDDRLDHALRATARAVEARPLGTTRPRPLSRDEGPAQVGPDGPVLSSTLEPALSAHVRSVYAQAPFVAALGITLTRLGVGETEVSLVVRDDHRQQNGFVHAGVVATLADHNAGGCALTLAPVGASVLSIEFKVNLLRPARGPVLVARSRALRVGRTVGVVESEVFDRRADGSETLVAKATVTLAMRTASPE